MSYCSEKLYSITRELHFVARLLELYRSEDCLLSLAGFEYILNRTGFENMNNHLFGATFCASVGK